jgi:AcrR family transcriptional regulator
MARRTQDERSEETRERLLSAAVEILTDRGYANFRIAEVSDVSGVSRGGLIHHYPSKDALIADVLEYVFQRVLRRAEAKLGSVNSIPSTLSAIVECGGEFFFGPDFPIYIDLVLAARRGGPLPKTARAVARRQNVSLEGFWTSSLVAQGLDERQAKDVVGMIFSLMRGLAIKAIGSTEPDDRERILKFALAAARLQIESRQTATRR